MSSPSNFARGAVRKVLNRVNSVLSPNQVHSRSKQEAELAFWRHEITRYVDWYEGRSALLYKTHTPRDEEKIKVTNIRDSSILTWHRLHQERKYLEDLELDSNAFAGMKLLDIGSGPMPSATSYRNAELYCLEPLLPRYLEAGFPLHYYGCVRYICAASEEIPVATGLFDAVISVNAIDHVDDLATTALEVQRVLKPGGLFRMHVHYHQATETEPLVLDDSLFLKHFAWCSGLRKVSVKAYSHSQELPPGESFALWTNF